jgi:hypothetical protein
VRQGDIHLRNDLPTGLSLAVLILSGPAYNAAGTGRVLLCPIITSNQTTGDYLTVHRVTYQDNGVAMMGYAVPELTSWLPVSALSPQPAGRVKDMGAVLATVRALYFA